MTRNSRLGLTTSLGLAAGLAVGAFGCGEPDSLPPAGHHVVHLDTDSHLPPGLGVPSDPTSPPPLFDRLEVSVIEPGAVAPCAECTRIFEADEALMQTGATLTITADPGVQPLVRARLYRRDSVFEGVLRPETAIEVVAELPATPEEGGLDTTILLLTESVGVAQGTVQRPLSTSDVVASPVRPGAVTETLVGSWPGARSVDCADDPDGDEVCVRGGAYWMGNPLAKGNGFAESDRQRLVIVSPFYLDKYEVTVGKFRDWANRQPDPVGVTPSDKSDPMAEAFFCTYSDEPDAESDARPVNCVEWQAATRFCEDHGGVLPSEAQFEYVSSALRSALYVWGQDELAVCEGAVWGRGGRIGTAIEQFDASQCSPVDVADDGPLAVPDDEALRAATRLTDRLTLRGGEIFDIAGNVQEWVLDYYNAQNEPCWSSPDRNVYRDPVCNNPGQDGGRAIRGGSWVQDRAFLRAAYRTARGPNEGERYKVGFRCARRAEAEAE